MSQGLCPSCGAAVNLTAGTTEAKCQYCDTLVTLQQAEAQLDEVKKSKVGGTLLIAQTAQEGGSYTEALTYYNKVIEQQPDFADAWLNKGNCMVRTSKIGDLKISEAISSWKAAIKFAKNTAAMKKRVATEINNVVSDFYPILESHYLRFHNLEDSLKEHADRFFTLESAQALALELNPTEIIARNGVSLCDRFVSSIKAAASSNVNDASSKLFLEKDWKGALASAATAGTKGMIASNIADMLLKTKNKYEQAIAKNDPEFARQLTVRTEKEKVNTEKLQKQANVFELIFFTIWILIFGYWTVIVFLKLIGVVATEQDTAILVGLEIVCAGGTLGGLGGLANAASRVQEDKANRAAVEKACNRHKKHKPKYEKTRGA